MGFTVLPIEFVLLWVLFTEEWWVDMGWRILLSSMSASVSMLGDSGWLLHIQNVLAGSAWIAARVAIEKASVLVHCRCLSLCTILSI